MSGHGRDQVGTRGTASVRPLIDAHLVQRLIDTQFPGWAHLPVTRVPSDGWDNRTFRLGDQLSVRLPSAVGYAAQVDKEHRWLPVLAPQLPLPVPVPVARGVPGAGYPFGWSVRPWLDGENARVDCIDDLCEFARALAAFLTALQAVDPSGGPPPGLHSAFRGGPLETYDAETRRAIEVLGSHVAGDGASAVWDAALAARWHGAPTWFHGDVAAGNLLVKDGSLSAVIDFGCCGVGDPACDLTMAWTFLSGESRRAFRAALGVDDATWARGRGWALWKAVITLAQHLGSDAVQAAAAARVIDHLLDDSDG